MSAPTIVEFDAPGTAAALPRSNGELVFDAPWQGRLFGLVVQMCQAGLFTWDEFKKHLIDVIGESGIDDVCDPSVYYRQFGEAFCRLALDKQFIAEAGLEERVRLEVLRLAHDDDHAHSHDHPHEH
ncbi:MAG: nitrile hydratase accessory protein [Actinomycetota bacterium]